MKVTWTQKPLPPLHAGYRWLWAICCLWFVGGLYLDGWAHIHLSELESFFTPWHAVFYSGYGLTTLVLLLAIAARRRSAGSVWKAIPAGEGLTLLGCALFALGGLGDMAWHVAFGVEKDIEALLSPTHILLAVSMTLIVSAGIRQEWRGRSSEEQTNILTSLPYALSIAFTFSTIVFMTQFGEYTDFPLAIGDKPASQLLTFYMQGSPIMAAIFFSGVLVGLLSIVLQHNRVPFGTVTLTLASVIAGISTARYGWEYTAAALVAGLVGDLLLEVAEWSSNRTKWLHIFGFALPFTFYSLVILTLLFTKGTWVQIHVWAGIPVLTGLSGFLMSFVAWPQSNDQL